MTTERQKLNKEYQSWKDSNLVDELKVRGIEEPSPFTRKDAIALLKENDKEEDARSMAIDEMDDDNRIKALGIDDLKKEGSVLMLSRVIFHNTSENDLPYIFIGCNGRCFYIPREIEVDVPDYLLDGVIRDAVEERMYNVIENGEIVWKKRRVQRFPYSIIKRSFPAL